MFKKSFDFDGTFQNSLCSVIYFTLNLKKICLEKRKKVIYTLTSELYFRILLENICQYFAEFFYLLQCDYHKGNITIKYKLWITEFISEICSV